MTPPSVEVESYPGPQTGQSATALRACVTAAFRGASERCGHRACTVRPTGAAVAGSFPPLPLSILRAAIRFPVRLKMAALSGAAVLVTLGIMLAPSYGRIRSALARAQGERLAA